MAFHLFSSNDQNQLLDRLVIDLSDHPLPNPLEPDILVVPNHGMQKWLSVRLAQKMGIASNQQYLFPNELLTKLFDLILESFPNSKISDRDKLVWLIYKSLSNLESGDVFLDIVNYLRSGNDYKRYQLSKKISGLFDQYCMYRPDWILKWKDHDSTEWQIALWHRLQKEVNIRLIPDWVELLKQNLPQQNNRLPKRFTFFGISNLTPLHLDVIYHLSQYSTVNFYFLNPSFEFWTDIQSRKSISKKEKKSPDSSQYLDEGNSLLAALGNVGRSFLGNLFQSNLVDDFGEDLFQITENPATLLENIQNDILTLTNPTSSALLKDTDLSIQLHSCHSPMREIEILHDQILYLLDQNSDLTPSDFIVMMPDVESYAPLIIAVFSQEIPSGPKIPFSIADRVLMQPNDILSGLFKILNLAKSQFKLSEVFEIMDQKSIQKKFSLQESDVEKLKIWLQDVNIRWGIDAKHREKLGAPAVYETTWEYGIERILAGFAVPLEEKSLLEISGRDSILPYDHVTGHDTEIFGQFLLLFDQLKQLVLPGKLNPEKRRSLKEWGAFLRAAISTFFVGETEWNQDMELITNFLEKIDLLNQEIGNSPRLDYEVFLHYLESELEENRSGYGFLGSGVTFCSMLPMRTIPAKVIAMIGMNEADFPRKNRPLSFDLMQKEKRLGDRSLKDEDRYIFLEAILSARQYLYLSYVGQSIQDNSALAPSMVITELMDYIKEYYTVSDCSPLDSICYQHSLQSFNKKYYDPEHPRFFSYQQENLEAISQGKAFSSKTPFLKDCDLDLPKDISIDELMEFFNNPAKYLLKKQLGIKLETDESEISDLESFSLDPLSGFQIQTELLDKMILNQDINNYLEILQKSGKFPLGSVGKDKYQVLAEETSFLKNELQKLGDFSETEVQSYQLNIDGLVIKGQIKIKSGQLIHYFPSRLKPVHYVRLWLEQLALFNMIKKRIPAVLIAKASDYSASKPNLVKVECFFSDPGNMHLSKMIDFYKRGMREPLAFFQKTTVAFFDSIQKGNTPEQALSKAENQWHGNDFTRGESEDPYFRKCFNHLSLANTGFEEIGLDILKPILEDLKFEPLKS